MPPINVLYLHSHDTGRYIQPYGYAVQTPNLQRFAEQGVLFRKAFCAAPTCSPSRAAMLTGQWAHCSGMLGLAHRGFTLTDPQRYMANAMRSAGYNTALAGVQHCANPKYAKIETLGYDKLLTQDAEGRAATAERAVEYIKTAKQPFYLDVGFVETHRKFPEPDPADDARYLPPPAPLPDTPEIRYDMAAFRAHARALDRKMGAVLAALDEAGLADNTLVICTTDHGIAFPHMKCNLTDHGIGVMLMIRGPKGFSGGKVIDAMVSQLDVLPTVFDALGIKPPPHLQGHSMMPLIDGSKQSIRDDLFAEVTYHAAYEPKRCIRTPKWKYIRTFDDPNAIDPLQKLPTGPVLPNCDDSPSKTELVAMGWPQQPRAREALYDLTFDPHETANLAADSRHAQTLSDLRNRLDQWMRQTEDPLLRGPVPLPPGGVANDPRGLSPNSNVLGARSAE